MWDWLDVLFTTDGFPPRWQCGNWPEWLGWLHIVSDVTTFTAYTAIPIVLASFILRRRDMPFPKVFLLFAAFIFACGAVHAVEAMIFWSPVYVLSGFLKGWMALVSVATVVALVPSMRKALALPGFQGITARFASIVSGSSDAIVATDLEGIVEVWNEGARRVCGYTEDEMIGTSIERVVPKEHEKELAETLARVRAGEQVAKQDTEWVSKDGRRIRISLTMSPVLGPRGQAVGLSAIGRDVTEQRRQQDQLRATAARLKRANRRLRELADRDPLTGLLNRRGFEDAVSGELERMRRHGAPAAVVLIDCDDFKAVNERYGHDGGDEVLREIGQRIEDTARETDHVARIGGDEFMVLATGVRLAEAAKLADRVRTAIGARAITTTSGEARVHVSCGVEPLLPNHKSLEEVLGESSSALRAAKQSGKNQVEVGGESKLRKLPTGEDLVAWVQPIIDVGEGHVTGYEFLVRGPRGPLQNPERLFNAFRARNQLSALDRDCLKTCLRAAARVPADLSIHVNLLPTTLLEEGAEEGAEEVVEALRRADLGARLCIEINESMLVGEPVALVPRVQELRARTGCRIAIDDVGFGRSSLEALIRLEPDVVKIDRHFVDGVASDPVRRRSLERLVHVGQALRADIVAEGVEREEDHHVLRELGVAYAQGYHYGRPRPGAEELAEDLLPSPRTKARPARYAGRRAGSTSADSTS